MAPELWLLAGGNGAGKSTFYRLYLAPLGIPFVNADLLARDLWPEAPEAHSYDAALLAGEQRSRLLRARAGFCFETVFSHPSKIDFLGEARTQGYRIKVVFIHLSDPQLNIARVAQRVSEGGHAVPQDKILNRLPRTLAHIARALPLCDECLLLDNSSLDAPFAPVAHWVDLAWHCVEEPLPAWARQVVDGP